MSDNKWTEDKVKEILSNPIYTGIGKYPKIISDEMWIKAQKQMIRENGSTKYFEKLLDELRKSF